MNVTSLAISGSNIFAGTDGDGVFLSTNSGNTWVAMNNGLSPSSFGLNVYSLAINGSNLIAGTKNGGVFLSTNNGISWTEISRWNYENWIQSNVISLLFDGVDIYAGTFSNGIWKNTLSIATQTESQISHEGQLYIYPNPATDKIAIYDFEVNSKSNSILSISDFLGKILLEKEISFPGEYVNIQDLASGIYLVRYTNNNRIRTMQLVKQ